MGIYYGVVGYVLYPLDLFTWELILATLFPFLLFGVLVGWIMIFIKKNIYPLLILFVAASLLIIEGIILFAVYHILE